MVAAKNEIHASARTTPGMTACTPGSEADIRVEDDPIRNVAIIGGGTAGWMCAAALAHTLGGTCGIRLVESEDIGTVGVGEATIPSIRLFNRFLGIDEHEFVAATQGTFKLGIQFLNWGRLGDSYFHPFGRYWSDFDIVPWYHYWLQAKSAGASSAFSDHSLAWAAAAHGRFDQPLRGDPRQIRSSFDYAYHFDAGAYARFLRGYCEARAVERLNGKVVAVERQAGQGFLSSVILADGRRVAADLFIDCSGFRSLLLGQALQTGFEAWDHWLPCDRAVAIPSKSLGSTLPYTQATARTAGWQWRIPLQHRVGNGYVFCSAFLSPEEALRHLETALEGAPIAPPRFLQFQAGHRKRFWEKNCVAIGLAAGFLEPLESTSIHLIQTAILRLIALFPGRKRADALREEFNLQTADEFEEIRDFIILHYAATSRTDAPLWQHVSRMSLPDSLMHKIEIFRSHAHIGCRDSDLFQSPNWLSVLLGQHIIPTAVPALARLRSPLVGAPDRLTAFRTGVLATALAMPSHDDYIARHCAAPPAP